jgi:hypothetical protein
MLFASVCNINTPGQLKESLGQTSQSLGSSFSGRTNATTALSLRESHNCDFGSERVNEVMAIDFPLSALSV